MDLIKSSIKGAFRRIDGFSNFKFLPGIEHRFPFETKRQPFDEEAIEKFGNGIIFSYLCNDDTLRKFMISKLEPWYFIGKRSRKRHNRVSVYFRQVDF